MQWIAVLIAVYRSTREHIELEDDAESSRPCDLGGPNPAISHNGSNKATLPPAPKPNHRAPPTQGWPTKTLSQHALPTSSNQPADIPSRRAVEGNRPSGSTPPTGAGPTKQGLKQVPVLRIAESVEGEVTDG